MWDARHECIYICGAGCSEHIVGVEARAKRRRLERRRDARERGGKRRGYKSCEGPAPRHHEAMSKERLGGKMCEPTEMLMTDELMDESSGRRCHQDGSGLRATFGHDAQQSALAGPFPAPVARVGRGAGARRRSEGRTPYRRACTLSSKRRKRGEPIRKRRPGYAIY